MDKHAEITETLQQALRLLDETNNVVRPTK